MGKSVKRTEIGTGIKRLLIATNETGGMYETVVLRPSYIEIDGGRYRSRKEALAAHDEYIMRYSEHVVSPPVKTLPVKYKVFAGVLSASKRKAEDIIKSGLGPTSIVSLQVELKYWHIGHVQTAARLAGMTAKKQAGAKESTYIIECECCCESNTEREKFVEILNESLNDFGYKSSVID